VRLEMKRTTGTIWHGSCRLPACDDPLACICAIAISLYTRW
jgi:hypothetical protein